MNLTSKNQASSNSAKSNAGAVKKANFVILTKEKVEADRSKAYSYVR